MANNQNDFNHTVDSLLKGLDGFLTSKTVVGEPIKIGEDILLPLADVSFGIGAGAFSGDKNDNGAGGLGAKMTPAAVLRIGKDGSTQLINLKSQDAVSKILDMAPGIVNRITGRGKGPDVTADDVADAFEDA
ncbi:MAG: hypothetical protein IJ860_08285 [Eubacterium sp.]|nr:hypothetical protein [Eubacterium sp.]